MKKETVAKMIDHTLLAPTAGIRDIVKLCTQAEVYHFASVCINPYFVAVAKNELSNSDVHICTVVGFPLGSNTTEVKRFEAVSAIKNGADEIDMVMNVGAAIDCRFNDVETDIHGVVCACREEAERLGRKVIVKVILETCFLDDPTIATACQCAVRAGADFVKTSTGFAAPKGIDGNLLPNGASVHHVQLMRKTVGADFGVKASGGIRSARSAASMILAGATRIGTSSGIQILDAWDESIELPETTR